MSETPHVVQGWNPLGDQPARSDAQIFELLTAAVFQARFRPDLVRARWPSIRAAFAGFDLATVATWPDERVAELLQAPGMIRSPKKITATLRNARDLLGLSRRSGGARAWIESQGPGEEERVRAIDAWAHYVGAPSLRWFVRNLDGQAGA